MMALELDIKGDQDAINVPLLAGLLSGIGTLFLALLCAILWFAISGEGSIRLGGSDPGSFDDDAAFEEEERDALEHMDERSRQEYLRAKEWIEAHPPNSANTDISLSQFMTIQEKGVSAWEFEIDFDTAGCFVERRTDIEFFDAVCSVQTNLPIPKQNEVYYWEAKIYEKAEDTIVSVGLATKPYPGFRLPGFHRYSVAYDSTGARRINKPFSAPIIGAKSQQGDIIGVGYRPRSGTVFFTRNGRKLEDALHGLRMNLFPTIGATGPCMISVNFGQLGFVYVEANAKKWGLAPAQGSLAPPPPYGVVKDSVLIESSTAVNEGNDDGDDTHEERAIRGPPPFDPFAGEPSNRPTLEDQRGNSPWDNDSNTADTSNGDNDYDERNARHGDSINLSQLPHSIPKRTQQQPKQQYATSESPPPSYTSDSETTPLNGRGTDEENAAQ